MRGCLKSQSYLLFYSCPTTKAVGSNFVTYSEPTDLPVGARMFNRKY
jgi:hypothetical protein